MVIKTVLKILLSNVCTGSRNLVILIYAEMQIIYKEIYKQNVFNNKNTIIAIFLLHC